MNRPLWQLLAMVLVIGFVLRRAAIVMGFDLAEGGLAPPLVAGYALQLGIGIGAGLLVVLEHRWVLPAVGALAAAVALTLTLEAARYGASGFDLLSGLASLAASLGLYAFLRRALAHPETRRDAASPRSEPG